MAAGKAFCNRRDELQRISYNLKNTNPMLLISPRRYGKTSIALQAFNQINWPYAHIVAEGKYRILDPLIKSVLQYA